MAAASLLLLPLLAIASDQEEQRKPLPTEPMEEYDDPPAPFAACGESEFHPEWSRRRVPSSVTRLTSTRSGKNITGDAANEPSIAVDPTNHNRMVIGWRQFNSVTSNFRQSGYGYTSNGGTTWTFPGVLENNVFRSDPVLACDDTGPFSLSQPSANHFLTTCGARSTAARPSPTSDRRPAATSSGSRSITTDEHGSRIPVPMLEHRR